MTKTVSIKMPEELKRRIERLSRTRGQTPHSFMLEAIREEAERVSKRRAFLRAAEETESELQRTGLAYEMKDVHDYLRLRLAGKRARRPKLKPWR